MRAMRACATASAALSFWTFGRPNENRQRYASGSDCNAAVIAVRVCSVR